MVSEAPPEKEVKRLLKGWGDNYLENYRRAAEQVVAVHCLDFIFNGRFGPSEPATKGSFGAGTELYVMKAQVCVVAWGRVVRSSGRESGILPDMPAPTSAFDHRADPTNGRQYTWPINRRCGLVAFLAASSTAPAC